MPLPARSDRSTPRHLAKWTRAATGRCAKRNRSVYAAAGRLRLVAKEGHYEGIVPPPRVHLLRFHGLLAPRARLRAAVVPPSRRDAEWCGGPGLSPGRPEPGGRASPEGGRLAWAALLKRVFALDLLRCGRGGGRRRVVAVYSGGPRLRDLLDRLQLSAPPGLPPPSGLAALLT